MEWIDISTSTDLHRFSTDDIVFIFGDGNNSLVYMVNNVNSKPYKAKVQLHVFEEKMQKLKDNHFVRLGKSIIINKNFVTYISLSSEPELDQIGDFFVKLKHKTKYNPNVVLSDKRLNFTTYLDLQRDDNLRNLKKLLEQEDSYEVQSK